MDENADESTEIDRTTKQVLRTCTVYPKPNPQQVQRELNKVRRVMKSQPDIAVSEKRLVKQVAKAFDMRQRLDCDGAWIEYHGPYLNEN